MKRKKLRRWKGMAWLMDGKIHAVHNGKGQPFNSGIFLSNEKPIRVEIREVRNSSASGK